MKRTSQTTTDEVWRVMHKEIVRRAQELLDKKVGVVEGVRALTRSQFGLEDDPDLSLLVGIDSETDRFPLGDVRRHWSSEALKRYDEERHAAEAHYRPHAERAARNLIARYGHKATEIQNVIRDSLIKHWDPIGVKEIAEAHDEYDSYVSPVYRLLACDTTDEQIIEYLYKIETETMGLTGIGRRGQLKKVVAKLREIDVKLWNA